ncbi:MAG: Spermidine/putrescine transport system permease protein PotB [Firmicutes bacterium]|nr:Spermidine/putrescine transport system permease protein PotB [Bacillota bacterium]MBT9158456.1 Spermidine/putrescine transport system permease protein PotB [Bacillota bacterium]
MQEKSPLSRSCGKNTSCAGRLYAAWRPYILVAPLVIFMGLTFVLALGSAVLQSLGFVPGAAANVLTLRFYREVLLESDFLTSLSYTIYIALVATLLSNLLGVMVAFVMLSMGQRPKWQRLLYQVPIVIPHLVVIVLVFHFFSQTGVASRLAYWLGCITHPNQFPLLVFDRLGIGIVLVYLYKQVPFATMIVAGTLENISARFKEAAYNLGAGRLQLCTQILLPLLGPTILSVFLITFAFTFGAFEVPFLIGTPAWNMLPVKAFFYYMRPDLTYRASSMVINVLITVISLGFAIAYSHILALIQRQTEGGER